MGKHFMSGVSFGLTSATITTLGLMMGLYSSTNSKMVVLGGIFIIAIADSFSDSLGVHITEESKPENSERDVWMITIFTFLSKLIFALSYVIAFLFFDINVAIVVNILWGYFLLSALSLVIAKEKGESPLRVVFEHVFIATLVLFITHYAGIFVAETFK